MTPGDFNGDDITDIATANYDSNDVSILLGSALLKHRQCAQGIDRHLSEKNNTLSGVVHAPPPWGWGRPINES
jgi:hypothetical protein